MNTSILISDISFSEVDVDVHDFFIDIALAAMKEIRLIPNLYQRPKRLRFVKDRNKASCSIPIQKMKEDNSDLTIPVQNSIVITLEQQKNVNKNDQTNYIKYYISVSEKGRKYKIFTILYYNINDCIKYSVTGRSSSSIVSSIKDEINCNDFIKFLDNNNLSSNIASNIFHALFNYFYQSNMKNFYTTVAGGFVTIDSNSISSYIQFFNLFQSVGSPFEFIKFLEEHMTVKQFLKMMINEGLLSNEVKDLVNIFEMTRI